MKGKLSVFLLTVVAFLLIVISVPAPIIIPQQGGGGGGGNNNTNGYSFSAGFTTTQATNVFMLPAISNLALNLPITNKWNAWQFWCDPVSTSTYHAENRGLGIKTNSTDFGAMLQSVLNRGTEGFSFKFEPNPFYTNAYVISNTVIVTNWGTWSGDLAGNPTVVFLAATNFTGPLFQLGAYGMQLGGISGWRDIRFEGDQGSTNCTGVELRNVVEPIFAFCEFTGFKATGIRVATTNAIYWTYVDNCWFVQKWTSSKGITFAATPIENQSQCHFRISGSTFGGAAGYGIIVSNWFPSLTVSGNRFFSPVGGMQDGIGIYAGEDIAIANNDFQNMGNFPIYFYDQATATNFSSSVTDNTMSTAGPVVVLGDKVQGVFMSGNSAATGGDPVGLAGNNGPNIVNFDRAELRLGFLTVTNRALYADASGLLKPVSSSSPSTEYVKADGTAGTPAGGTTNFITTAHGSIYATNSVTAQSFIGSGTGTPQLQLFATNGNAAVMGIAISNSVMVTNLVGIIHQMGAGGGIIVLDANNGQDWVLTNRITAATTIVFTNMSQGQEYKLSMLGTNANFALTINAFPPCLIYDLDAFGATVTTNKSLTLSNGNALELSWRVNRWFGTNAVQSVTRQFAY